MTPVLLGSRMHANGPRRWSLDIATINCAIQPWDDSSFQAFVDNRRVATDATLGGCVRAIEDVLGGIADELSAAFASAPKKKPSPKRSKGWLRMADLIEALQIFAKYKSVDYPTNCSHDFLAIMAVGREEPSAEDLARLGELGFYWSSEHDCWGSSRFGSA